MVIMYLDSVLAAGFFGGVLAQHRQSNGTERAALVAVVKAPVGNYRRNLGVYFFLGAVTLAYSPRLVWMMLPGTRYDAMDAAIGLLACLAFLLFIHILCVLGWLNGAVFADDSSPAVVLWFATVAMLFLGSFALVGKLAAVTVLWLCVLASTMFLGYFLRIHASYDRIMTIRACAEPSSTVTAPRTTEGCPATAPEISDTTKFPVGPMMSSSAALPLSATVASGSDPAAPNVLCSALKRMQGLGVIDGVELEHCVVSIPDDPGIDRVTRKAASRASS
ncbi:hypothetical protein ACQ4PT_017121 [Festuca glaucescens]